MVIYNQPEWFVYYLNFLLWFTGFLSGWLVKEGIDTLRSRKPKKNKPSR